MTYPRTLALLAALVNVSLASAQLRPADPAALPESGMPYLATGPNGALYLSWIDPLPNKQHALRYSRWNGAAWAAPETIATGTNWFVNWADFPALSAQPDGSLLAHWLTRPPGGGADGYGIRMARKANSKAPWIEIFGASLDNLTDYAGFLSFTQTRDGGAVAAYLAPPPEAPPMPGHNHEDHSAPMGHRKTLRAVTISPTGKVASDRELDSDTCTCCGTTTIATSRGLFVAYRDHLPGEIRDISFLRFVDGAWSEPKPVHRDGWKINGCPVEGPSAASLAGHVGIAWYTRAQNTPRLNFALSHNSGDAFAPPQRIDGGNPLGRPATIVFDTNHFLVAWLEHTADGAEFRLRRVSTDGKLYPPITIAQVAAARSAGFPKLALTGNQIVLAWRDSRVRSAWLSKSSYLTLEKAQNTK